MRKTLCGLGLFALLLAALAAEGATSTTARKKSAKGSKTAAASSKKGTKSASRRKSGKKGSRTTWRNRQTAPAPERYKEIQDALVAKGYLKPEEATSVWNQTSIGALKKFQSAQNIDASGKINSLSLIALGLGPKHDNAAPVKPPPNP